jgi:small conductance mechanosensitive channel
MPFEFSVEYFKYFAEARLIPFGINLFVALLVFYVGRAIARFLTNTFHKVTAKKIDESLRKFTGSVIYSFLLAVVIIAALERLGVRTTAAIAILGAAGLAIGLAFQGTLGNLASGVLLMVFRPFKVGDLVTAGGHTGVVGEISVFTTTMKTPDNKIIIIPNGAVAGGSITNYTAEGTRRIDLVIGVGYGDDLNKAKEVLETTVAKDERVLKEPATQVAVAELGASSVDFVVRPWVNVADYWDVKFALTKAIKEALDEAGLNIPYPQRDLHIIDRSAA